MALNSERPTEYVDNTYQHTNKYDPRNGLSIVETQNRLDTYNPRVNQLFYRALGLALDAYIALELQGYEATGTENIPSKGSAIFVPNHTSHIDHPALGKGIFDAVQRPVRIIANDGFWSMKYGNVKGRFVERGGGVPMVRHQGLGLDKQPVSPDILERGFDQGLLFGWYEEGKRVYQPLIDGGRVLSELGKFKRGAVKTAMRYQVPLIPVGIAGTQDRDFIAVVFGKPFVPPHVEDQENMRQAGVLLNQNTRELRERVIAARLVAHTLREERLGIA